MASTFACIACHVVCLKASLFVHRIDPKGIETIPDLAVAIKGFERRPRWMLRMCNAVQGTAVCHYGLIATTLPSLRT